MQSCSLRKAKKRLASAKASRRDLGYRDSSQWLADKMTSALLACKRIRSRKTEAATAQDLIARLVYELAPKHADSLSSGLVQRPPVRAESRSEVGRPRSAEGRLPKSEEGRTHGRARALDCVGKQHRQSKNTTGCTCFDLAVDNPKIGSGSHKQNRLSFDWTAVKPVGDGLEGSSTEQAGFS